MGAPARLFGANTITDIAPVAALPTTAAHFAIWNGEPPGGKTYAFWGLGFTTSTSSGAGTIIEQLIGHVCPGYQIGITGTAAKGPLPLDGQPRGGANGSNAQVNSAVTLTANQVSGGYWHPIGPPLNGQAATATIGLGSWVNVNGIYYLAPGAILSLAVFCSAANSAKCLISATWQEVQF